MATSISSQHRPSVICSLPPARHTSGGAGAVPVGGGHADVAAHLGREIRLLAGHGIGAVLETPPPGLVSVPTDELAAADRSAVTTLLDVRARHHADTSIEIHATVYPDRARPLIDDDGVDNEVLWRRRLRNQVDAGAEFVAGRRVRSVASATAVAVAAREAGAACVIWFSPGEDGRLADDTTPAEAIVAVDEATGCTVRWYGLEDIATMVLPARTGDDPTTSWVGRIGGVRTHARPDGADHRQVGDRLLLAAAALGHARTFGCTGEGCPDEVQALAERLAALRPLALRTAPVTPAATDGPPASVARLAERALAG
ncbi:MAG: hypothetical protein S0880_05805 [Actinomycetota bacterium]|nr:hypothetical protein [Actinomycetota bacterium]